MYLSNPDLHPTGYEPAEFIDVVDTTAAEPRKQETSGLAAARAEPPDATT